MRLGKLLLLINENEGTFDKEQVQVRLKFWRSHSFKVGLNVSRTRYTSRRRFFDVGQQLTKAQGTIMSITMEFPLSRHVSFLSRTSGPSTRA